MSGELPNDNGGENQEKVLDPRVESLAIPLARDYAEKNYPKREDGTFEPAWRGKNGEKNLKNKSPEDLMAEGYSTLAAHDAVIDIANEPYNEYSEYWKEQNRGGAEFLIGLMDERGEDVISDLDLEDEKVRAEYGDLVHENWISRNEWVKDPNYGDPRLACSFAELSPEEQQKDIDQLGVLQKWIKDNKEDDNGAEQVETAAETSGEKPAMKVFEAARDNIISYHSIGDINSQAGEIVPDKEDFVKRHLVYTKQLVEQTVGWCTKSDKNHDDFMEYSDNRGFVEGAFRIGLIKQIASEFPDFNDQEITREYNSRTATGDLVSQGQINLAGSQEARKLVLSGLEEYTLHAKEVIEKRYDETFGGRLASQAEIDALANSIVDNMSSWGE